MKYDISVVDAFTAHAFRGNPAAVCILREFPENGIMQAIATEMNHSETAFAVRVAQGEYRLRWFTPTCEVDLCGHATLATAHTLAARGEAQPGDTLSFHTVSGVLKARIQEESIVLDFPLQPGERYAVSPYLRTCVNVEVLNAQRNAANILIEIPDFSSLLTLQPNIQAIAGLGTQGLIVTTSAGCGAFDFASRYFAPNVGVTEDPVCGSAHCMLAPYWSERLGKQEMLAYQASPRGGELGVAIAGSRVMLEGQAVTTLTGSFETGEVHAAHHAA